MILSEAISAVRDLLQGRTDVDDLITRNINWAQSELVRRIPIREATVLAQAELQEGEYRFTLPPRCMSIFNVTLVDSTASVVLAYMPAKAKHVSRPYPTDDTPGKPSHWTQTLNEWQTDVPVDSNYIVQFTYLQWPAELSEDAEELIENYSGVIVKLATSMSYTTLRQPEMALFWKGLAESELQALKKIEMARPDYNALNVSGVISDNDLDNPFAGLI